MIDQHRAHPDQSQAFDVDKQPSQASDVADLLDLLADSRERAEDARSKQRAAETRADKAMAEVASLRSEIDGMTVTLVELDRKRDLATAEQKTAESRASGLQSRVSGLEAALRAASERGEAADRLTGELDIVRSSEQSLRLELDRIKRSWSWKLTAPLRAATRSKA